MIVVIGILAAITIVAYNGIQQRAGNATTQQGVAAYAKAMSLYAVTNGVYPGAGTYRCLKDSANNNTCGQVSTSVATCFGIGMATRESAFDTALTTVSSTLPVVSSQSMLCGGEPYRGAYVDVAVDGKFGLFYVFYKGFITCPPASGVGVSGSSQSGNVTLCTYQLQTL